MTFRRERMQGFAMNGHRTTFALGVILMLLFGLLPQLAQAGAYADSAHGDATNGVDRGNPNYAPGNCAHCHEQHASVGGGEPDPIGGPDDYLLFDDASTGNDFCAVCHGSDGATNPPTGDVASAADYTASVTYISGHDPGSSMILGSEPLCVVCHDVHSAQDTLHSEAVDGNTASGVLLNVVGGYTYTWSPPSTPAADTENLSKPTRTLTTNPITKEYELCLKCHTFNGSPPGASGWTDQGEEFNPNNYSHHPVTGTGIWKNKNIRANPTSLLNAPWSTNVDARMHCSDCHGSGVSGDPKGPHGSNNKYILKAWGGYNGTSYPNAAKAPDLLCIICHSSGYGTGSVSGSPWSHGSNSAHQYQAETGTNNQLGCYACHGGPAGYANFTGFQTTSNGGRTGAIHGENFYWKYPVIPKKASDANDQPADHFLTGGYNVGIYLDDYNGGSDDTGKCWSAGPAGADPCGSMAGGKGW